MNAKTFFETFDIQPILSEIEHSLVGDELPENLSFNEEMITSYLEDDEYQKYFISGYEALGICLLQLFKSGKGYYIMSYVHDFGVNRYSIGFETKEELFHYANYVVEKGIEMMLRIKEKVYELKAIEDKMDQEEIFEKNLDYLKTKLKILENIFDMEAKVVYCERLRELETVQTTFNQLIEHYQLIYPIYRTLDKIGELRNVA